MNKIKQQISQIRSTMPRHIQWLLLAAAFIVVLILMTLLLTGGGDDDNDLRGIEAERVSLTFDAEPIDWSNTIVGEKKTATIKINASAPALVDVQTKKSDGFKASHTCQGEVNKTIPCRVILEYTPTKAMPITDIPLYLNYRGVNEDEKLNSTETVMITVGATAPVIEPRAEPKPKPEPVAKPIVESKPEPAPMPKAEPVISEPTPIRTEIQREIEAIAPAADPFKNSIFDAADDEDEEPGYVPAPEKCSDFAFPGYNASGNQIGWIKPENGAYYFHPFSDKNCDSPTGVYNPDNGIITDINDITKKIGTDAEHIGYTILTTDGTLPALNDSPRAMARAAAYAGTSGASSTGGMAYVVQKSSTPDVIYESSDKSAIVSTRPHDRSFILRQYKPIPATIVSDVRADVVLNQGGDKINFPVRATVDRNVYADNGRTIVIPTGTLLLGYVTGEVPGPYKAIGRMQIRWYQFILPNGVEFNFNGGPGSDPFSGDSQGRVGVPGRGSTDYLEQFVMPMLTAIVPAAVNMIAPIADKFVNQIDLDNNTVVQSGTVRSSELAKNEIITAWNQIAQKLMVDMMDNTVPPFTIPAGTRITVYSPVDLVVSCGEDNGTDPRKCALGYGPESSVSWGDLSKKTGAVAANDSSWVGQVRGFNWAQYCDKDGNVAVDPQVIYADGLDYRNVLFYCKSNQYQAINNARQDAMFQAQKNAFANTYGTASNTGEGMWGKGNTNAGGVNGGGLTGIVGDSNYNANVLGLVEDENGYLSLPVEQAPAAEAEAVLTCLDGSLPDQNGCCAGEEYTDMGEQGFNCCPIAGGDCFPPIL